MPPSRIPPLSKLFGLVPMAMVMSLLFVMRAAGNGVSGGAVAALVDPFVTPFFEGSQTCSRNCRWRQRAYFRVFSPATASTTHCGVVLLVVLSKGTSAPVLRRMLVEEDDELRRANGSARLPRGGSLGSARRRLQASEARAPRRQWKALRAIAVRAAMKSRSGIGKRSVVNPSCMRFQFQRTRVHRACNGPTPPRPD